VSYLVDTNVISELCRRQPNQGVLAWASGVTRPAVSVITLEEIFFGLTWRPNPRVLEWMESFFQRHEVLPISQNIARRGGELRGQFSARGIVREQADMLIAATAQVHQLTLVTRNTRDFENCGIGLLNPFSGSDAQRVESS
jgi:predicted nucleic acid-binding protein